MSRPPAKQLHLPDRMKYDCVQCGRGCTDWWEIPVDEASEQRLSKLDLKSHQQAAPDKPPFEDSPIDGKNRVLARSNDRCVFLTANCQCALHRAFGPKDKPQTCIDFPFRYVETPAGAYVGLSFACTAVLQEHGAAVEAKRADLADNYIESVHVRTTEQRPKLTARIAIDFDAYLEIEQALDEIMAQDRFEVARRLLAQSVYIDLAVRTFEAARLGPGEAPHAVTEEERDAAAQTPDADLVRHLNKAHRADKWGRLFLMGLRHKASPALQRAFLGFVITFRQALWRDATRAKALVYVARQYLGHATKLGRIRLQPYSVTFQYADFAAVHVDRSPGAYFDYTLTRYFRHALFRKDLLLAETIRTGHRFMLMHYALVNWYVMAAARKEALPEPSSINVQEAISNVEKLYVSHSRFTDFLERQPVLATLVESILFNPRYAATMTGPPV